MKKVMVEEMSWYEFRDAMSSNDLIIVPIGSIEEHGPHSALLFDTAIARETAKAIGKRVKAPVVPVMPIGNARSLMGFPGTVSIDPELIRELMVQVCEGFIKHGAKRILFINSHGGNSAAIKVVCDDLYAKYGVMSVQAEWYSIVAQNSQYKRNDHGGQYGTAIVMAIDKSLIDLSKANTIPMKNLTDEIVFKDSLEYRGVGISLPFTVDKFTTVGNYGPKAEDATLEQGREMFNLYVDYCVKLAEELRKIPL